jgi:hypothetical protein
MHIEVHVDWHRRYGVYVARERRTGFAQNQAEILPAASDVVLNVGDLVMEARVGAIWRAQKFTRRVSPR